MSVRSRCEDSISDMVSPWHLANIMHRSAKPTQEDSISESLSTWNLANNMHGSVKPTQDFGNATPLEPKYSHKRKMHHCQ